MQSPALLTPESFHTHGTEVVDGIRFYDTFGIEQWAGTEWLVEGLIQEQTTTILYGKYGSYKTFFTLDLALSVAVGRDFLGRPVQQGRVVYFYLEGFNGLRQRWLAWKEANAIDRVEDIRVTPHPLAILGTSQLERAIKVLRDPHVRPTLIVIDTLSAFLKGTTNEDSTWDGQRLMDACREIRLALGCTILIVHHANKKGGIRGSITIPSDADAVLKMRKRRGARISVECDKQRDGEPFEPFFVKPCIVQIDDDISAPVLHVVSIEDKSEQQSGSKREQRREQKREAVCDALRQLGDWQPVKAIAEEVRSSKETVRELAFELVEQQRAEHRKAPVRGGERDEFRAAA